jgi:hypothetical protein
MQLNNKGGEVCPQVLVAVTRLLRLVIRRSSTKTADLIWKIDLTLIILSIT